MTPRITIIAALGKNREIGRDNQLLWHISDDLKRFKKLTMGHPIVMGRKTFESIGKPLPGRTNIIVTRDYDWKFEGVVAAHSIEQALEKAAAIDGEEMFVIGGAQVYAQALPYANRLQLTLIEETKDADTYFPEYENAFAETATEAREQDGLHYRWITLERSVKAQT